MNISTIINAINEFEKLAQHNDPQKWKDAHDLIASMANVGTEWVDRKVSAILKKPAQGQAKFKWEGVHFEPLPGQNDYRYSLSLDSKNPDIRKWLPAIEVELRKYLMGKFPGERIDLKILQHST